MISQTGADSSVLVVGYRWGESFGFYDEVPAVLQELRSREIRISVASRSSAPVAARDMLRLLNVGDAAGADKAFYDGKIAVASFFAKSFLPLLSSTRLVLDTIDNEVMELDEASF